ncbi:allantoate amidohydrolase [Mycobacteroides abscessus]|uniref:allantoate amidohydrolase n=1 Tax=Mycobacteroides abscessus TaxID=36809 RepID=UPI00092BE9FF|nr:allantoate amidohydrolase [Mycobacteroides abscessus]SHR30931.1 amidase, hydantoinase/carbamoylase family [Mycobacteroides abscessus subsp. bolletii]SHT32927.1 amidase, hydantoinase/carbamoylase family [Mycobacteroides abscessus subsp. bolletii]SHT51168.1 amidase, hydantoinase/carbamoylase family [Mycobacteroides abscessus subsp. bolletii]SKG64360.1 amidase, hydantoinase/carbamoylase family [Mycobacteroides abscessus subsp. bolletii]SKH19494.1 amidase, hydantoinase/carbamoylase family [Myco
MSAFDSLWESILGVGRDPVSGGYRRFAWSAADLTLREWFTGEAQQRGLSVEEDRNGNLWAWWLPAGHTGDPRDAFVTGSHLDSVPDGGPFDGPLGIVTAFAAITILQRAGVTPRRPVAVVAFSDEEGARFGVACVGSQLSAGAITAERALGLRDADGTSLAEAMRAAGRDPRHVGVDPTLPQRVGVYVELHVEQGRALDLIDKPLAVASAIWPHGRWQFAFCGEANHAGATRLVDRRDPMLTFATSVHDARDRAIAHQAVATFGKVRVTPNGANAIPAQVLTWLDARAADEDTLRALVADIAANARRNAEVDRTSVQVEAESISPAVHFPDEPRDRIQRILTPQFGTLPVLPTAAGHDAGVLAVMLPTAMLFVRNPTGVSHSPDEYAEISDCHLGTDALAAVMADWIGG